MTMVRIELRIEGIVARTEYGYYKDADIIRRMIKAEEIQGRRAMNDVRWEINMYIFSK